MRIIFITDTHLAMQFSGFTENWHAARKFANHFGADLTIHLGDITMHGIGDPEQLNFAYQLTRKWPTPFFCLPGNHDIGDNPPAPAHPVDDPFNEVRLKYYRQLFGADYWLHEINGWQLLGLNAQLFGSETQSETEQWLWLEIAAQRHSGFPTIVCLHKPLFRNDPNDTVPHIRYVPYAPRQRLLTLLARLNVRLIVSGHTHQYLDRVIDGIRHLWLPSTAFYIPDIYQECIGQKNVGLGVLTLSEKVNRFDLVNPDGMVRHNIADFVTYPVQRRIEV